MSLDELPDDILLLVTSHFKDTCKRCNQYFDQGKCSLKNTNKRINKLIEKKINKPKFGFGFGIGSWSYTYCDSPYYCCKKCKVIWYKSREVY